MAPCFGFAKSSGEALVVRVSNTIPRLKYACVDPRLQIPPQRAVVL